MTMLDSFSGLAHPDALFIGGTWRQPATSRRFQITHPGTRDIRLSVPEAREADVEIALAAARNAFDFGPWPMMTVAERAVRLTVWAEALEARADDLAQAYTTEVGVALATTRMMAGSAAAALRGAIAWSQTYPFVAERPARGGIARIMREPVGVVAAIVPWNFPGGLGMLKLAPALLAGCCVIAKPSPEAPLDMLIFAECAAAAGLPEGVLSVLPADREIGNLLISDPRVDKVSFTGSTAAGKHIGAVCMGRVARVSLELGGKSAAIVLDDAPLVSTVPTLVGMSTLLSGQACMALTRVLVPRARADELVQALAAAYSAIRVGDPFDAETRMGPLAGSAQRDRVEGYVAQNAIGPQPGMPFGGFKQSGIGRENSIEAFDLFTEVKAVYLQRAPSN